MGFVQGLSFATGLLSSSLLVLAVLLQEPRGVGIAAALGSSGSETFGVPRGGVNRFTCGVAGVWMASCLVHAVVIRAWGDRP